MSFTPKESNGIAALFLAFLNATQKKGMPDYETGSELGTELVVTTPYADTDDIRDRIYKVIETISTLTHPSSSMPSAALTENLRAINKSLFEKPGAIFPDAKLSNQSDVWRTCDQKIQLIGSGFTQSEKQKTINDFAAFESHIVQNFNEMIISLQADGKKEFEAAEKKFESLINYIQDTTLFQVDKEKRNSGQEKRNECARELTGLNFDFPKPHDLSKVKVFLTSVNMLLFSREKGVCPHATLGEMSSREGIEMAYDHYSKIIQTLDTPQSKLSEKPAVQLFSTPHSTQANHLKADSLMKMQALFNSVNLPLLSPLKKSSPEFSNFLENYGALLQVNAKFSSLITSAAKLVAENTEENVSSYNQMREALLAHPALKSKVNSALLKSIKAIPKMDEKKAGKAIDPRTHQELATKLIHAQEEIASKEENYREPGKENLGKGSEHFLTHPMITSLVGATLRQDLAKAAEALAQEREMALQPFSNMQIHSPRPGKK